VDDALPGKVGRDNAPSQAGALRERALSPAPLIEDLKKIMCWTAVVPHLGISIERLEYVTGLWSSIGVWSLLVHCRHLLRASL
jgi:hypothetical protein